MILSRLYEAVLTDHFRVNRQMLFLMGPRQVGKTTSSRLAGEVRGEFFYYSWDNQKDRLLILGGPDRVVEDMRLHQLREKPPLAIFDELHKYGQWKTFLKGLFDSFPQALHLVVTGSARLDVFKAGGDSLMGRYFFYRMHPLSVAELARPGFGTKELIRPPAIIDTVALDRLIHFGGFPEPFVRSDRRFYNRWRRLRSQQLFKEELRDLTRIQELGQIEVLAELLGQRVGQLVSYTSLSKEINVSVDTIRRWLKTLTSLYYCFPVRPWSKNVSRSLRKEPKYFLWDWSLVQDRGARLENMMACALLKAVHFWTDHGLGDFGLYFVRDKEKREVDFLVSRDHQPWFLVEVKGSVKASLSKHLVVFQEMTGAQHAFQVAFDMSPVHRDCFSQTRPVIVPAQTFLSQLV